MESVKASEIIAKYYRAVCDAYRLGNVESSYNAPIMALFTDIGCAARDLSGERKGQTGENIDIKLWHSEEEVTETEPFAGVEVKKVGGIDKRALSQIKIEADRYGNAVLTDNLEWRFWRAGDTEMYTGLRIMELVNGKLVLKEDNVELFISLVEDFLLRDPAQIKSSTKLAEYMAMHDPVYCEKYEQYLCRDFPRVPIINTPEKERDEGEFYVSEELYREYVSVGERLRKLHLMQIKAPAELALEPNTPDDMEIGAIKYKNGVLQLNANKRITGISQEVWKYQIGGHQVLDKWFKEHKGEVLTIDAFTHIENVVGLLEETIKLREYLRRLH